MSAVPPTLPVFKSSATSIPVCANDKQTFSRGIQRASVRFRRRRHRPGFDLRIRGRIHNDDDVPRFRGDINAVISAVVDDPFRPFRNLDRSHDLRRGDIHGPHLGSVIVPDVGLTIFRVERHDIRGAWQSRLRHFFESLPIDRRQRFSDA